MPTDNPRVTASSAAPAPTTPPPTMRMSSSLPGSVVPLRTSMDLSRASGLNAPVDASILCEPSATLLIGRLPSHKPVVPHTTSCPAAWAGFSPALKRPERELLARVWRDDDVDPLELLQVRIARGRHGAAE